MQIHDFKAGFLQIYFENKRHQDKTEIFRNLVKKVGKDKVGQMLNMLPCATEADIIDRLDKSAAKKARNHSDLKKRKSRGRCLRVGLMLRYQ